MDIQLKTKAKKKKIKQKRNLFVVNEISPANAFNNNRYVFDEHRTRRALRVEKRPSRREYAILTRST